VITEYEFHPEAAADLDAIWTYIAEDSPEAADRIVSDIVSAIERVVRFPRSGFRRPKWTSRNVRFTLAREYLVAYAPEEKPLWVVAVVHGHRSPRTIRAMLHTRQ
jgi:toxin ParE1/3/4